MTELLPPDGMTLDAAGETLGALAAVADGEIRPLHQTFYDTFDGLLRAAGLTLVGDGGRFRLLDAASGEERHSAASLEELPLREVCGVRTVLPLATLEGHARLFRVLNDERKTVVRVALEQSALSGEGVPLRPRVRLTALRGYGAEHTRLAEHLEHELGFRAVDQPLVDEAVRAAGRPPAGISSKVEVELEPDEGAQNATALVLRRLLEVIEANLPGTLEDLDTEFLHDFRVSVRRSRAVQRQCKRVFPPERLQTFRDEFKWLQQVTGDVRDLDVYLLEFEDYRALVPDAMRPDLDPLLAVLRRRRARAREGLEAALRSERCQRVLAEWRAFLDELPSLPAGERPWAETPIAELAGMRIRKVYRRMVKMGKVIEADTPAEEYHELRKKGKELRYMLELFGKPLFPSDVVSPMVKTLKALQDVLGRHQDREVQTVMLRSLADDVARERGGPAALMAMGVLVQRLGEDERAARSEFAESFAAFASKSQRALVAETFA